MAKKKEDYTMIIVAKFALAFLAFSLISLLACVWTYDEVNTSLSTKWCWTFFICFGVGMFLGSTVAKSEKGENHV